MKVVFLCGSLEPGRDGVGDYTRRLSGELIRQGHEVRIIALKDKSKMVLAEEVQSDNTSKILTLRIPKNISDSRCFSAAKEWINSFKPDWLSLQYVPFSFHEKGLPFNLEKKVKSLSNQAKWHIMLHEIWLDDPKTIKQKLTSLAQKAIICRLANLSPKIINTSITYNKERLEKVNLSSEILPLFGNISCSSNNSRNVAGTFDSKAKHILYFGVAPRDNFLDQTVNGILNFSERIALNIKILLIVSESNQKQLFIEKLKALRKNNLEIIDYGYVDSNDLSDLISISDAGIVRSELKFLGKSGTAMAMLEHGLPIWLPKYKNEKKINFFREDLVFSDLYEAVYNKNPEIRYFSLLEKTADQFIKQLSK